jgi:hypothetical protein
MRESIMERTVFEIMEASREIYAKNKSEIVEGCTTKSDDVDNMFVKSTNERFENEADAMEFLLRMESVVRFYESTIPYYEVTEFFVEVNVYDEDDTWVNGGDICGYSKMPEFK